MLSHISITSLITAMTILSDQSMALPKTVCTALPQVTQNFDSQTYTAGTLLPDLQPVGTVGDLNYYGFSGINDILNTGVRPSSSPNEIITGLQEMAFQGQAYISASSNSNTSYFDLKSFNFGCSLDTVTGLIGSPTGCTITATGYYQGVQLIVQEFDYSPVYDDAFNLPLSASGKTAKTQKAAFRSFNKVDKVEFGSGNPNAVVFLLDDVSYVPYQCPSSS